MDSLFFNPNIYPPTELEKRWEVQKVWGETVNLKVLRADAPHDLWLEKVRKTGLNRPNRCWTCYELRLMETARLAKEKGYDAFTTSLLVSPYQDTDALKSALFFASKTYAIPFLNHDFKKGYRRSRELARGAHLYMQKYCGCEFSLEGE